MTNRTPGQRFGAHLRDNTEGIRAEMGRLNSDGSYTVRVENVTNEVYVRIEGDERRTVQAINLNTAYKARLPVRIRLNASSRRYEVIGLDPIEAPLFLGEAAPAANIPPLATTDDMAVAWKSEQLKPGRIRPLNSTGLQVVMEELVYGETLLGKVNGDLTTAVGSIAASKKAPIVISVNPVDNTLTITKGTDAGLASLITLATALAVTIPTGDIRLWAYVCANGDTELPTYKRYGQEEFQFDLRQWVTPTSVIQLPVSNDDVTNPPTDAELTTAFGTQNDGFMALLDDNGAGTDVWIVTRKNSQWWYMAMTAAV